jgi:hypothetical protein
MMKVFVETGLHCLAMGILGVCASFILTGIIYGAAQTFRRWKEMTQQ